MTRSIARFRGMQGCNRGCFGPALTRSPPATPSRAPQVLACSYLVRSVASGWNTCEGTPVPQPGASSKMLSKPSAHSKFCARESERGSEAREEGSGRCPVRIAAKERRNWSASETKEGVPPFPLNIFLFSSGQVRREACAPTDDQQRCSPR